MLLSARFPAQLPDLLRGFPPLEPQPNRAAVLSVFEMVFMEKRISKSPTKVGTRGGGVGDVMASFFFFFILIKPGDSVQTRRTDRL